MNILQVQDTLKNLSDQQLQTQLLNPDGSAPSFLVLSELQRRKDMRSAFSQRQQQMPGRSMADEFASGMGSAEVGQYTPAMRAAVDPNMSPDMAGAPQGPLPGESPVQVQGFADGGLVNEAEKARQAHEADYAPTGWFGIQRKSLDTMDPVMGIYRGIQEGKGFGDIMQRVNLSDPAMGGIGAIARGENFGGIVSSMGRAMLGPLAGPLGLASGGSVSDAVQDKKLIKKAIDQHDNQLHDGAKTTLKLADGGSVMPNFDGMTEIPFDDVPESYVRDTRTLQQRFRDAMKVPSRDFASGAVKGLVELPWQEIYRKNQQMVDQERAMNDQFWTADPGKSVGQSISDKVMGRGPLGMPRRDPGETGGTPEVSLQPYPRNVGPTDFTGGDDVSIMGEPAAVPRGLPGAVGQPGGTPGPAGGAGGGGGGGRTGGGGGGGTRLNQPMGGDDLDQYWQQIQGLRLPNRFDEITARNEEDLAKLRAGMEGQKGLALLQAGLGIMGGESPFAAVNIGRGAQAGVKQWNEATKEMRLAERDIRNAENQITIAKSARDDKLLEGAMKLQAQAQLRREAALDRANRSGIAAADRAQMMALKEKEFEFEKENRRERLEDSRITNYGSLAQKYDALATAAETKMLAIKADPMADPREQKVRIDGAQAELDQIRLQGDQYRELYKDALINREVRTGRIKSFTSPDAFDKALEDGTIKKGDTVVINGKLKKVS